MLDIFTTDAFKTVKLMTALDRVPYVPNFLGSLGIFDPEPVDNDKVAIEKLDGTLALIKTSERGAPGEQMAGEKRDIRLFQARRLYKRSRVNASELFRVRAMGQEMRTQTAQEEVLKRMVRLRRDVDLTWEYHRLGAVQGILLDSDGSTIYNFFTEWNVAQDAEIDFDLDNANPASGAVRKLCNQVVRQTLRALKLGQLPNVRIVGLCGDAFWDDLTAHKEVRETYLNQQEARELRKGNAFETLDYGGITFVNYRGTDDTSTVALGTDKAKFFPVGVPDLFKAVWAPGESFEDLGMPGKPIYPKVIPDLKRNQFVDVEVYSYPLFMCCNPKCLQRAKRT